MSSLAPARQARCSAEEWALRVDLAACVLHTHSPAATAVSCLAEGFVPMTKRSA